MITKKVKHDAMVFPLEESGSKEEGLIKARGALSNLDDYIDDMVNFVYEAREKERKINDWPESIIRLAGVWQDLPTAEEIKQSENKE